MIPLDLWIQDMFSAVEETHNSTSRMFLKEHNLWLSELKKKLISTRLIFSPSEVMRLQRLADPPAKEDIFYFITISPKIDVCFKTFKERVDKYVNRKMMLGCYYVYEQTGTTEEDMGYHPHIHLILSKKKGLYLSHLQRDSKNTFKGLGNSFMVDIKEYPDRFRTEKMQYLTGVKWEPGKEEACALNLVWRKKLGLENLYHIV